MHETQQQGRLTNAEHLYQALTSSAGWLAGKQKTSSVDLFSQIIASREGNRLLHLRGLGDRWQSNGSRASHGGGASSQIALHMLCGLHHACLLRLKLKDLLTHTGAVEAIQL